MHLTTSIGTKFRKSKLRVDFVSSKKQTQSFSFLGPKFESIQLIQKLDEFRGKRLPGNTFQLNVTSKILDKASFLSRNIQIGKSEIAMSLYHTSTISLFCNNARRYSSTYTQISAVSHYYQSMLAIIPRNCLGS